MKTKYIIAVLLLIASCKNIEPNELVGSWKTENTTDYTGKNISNKMTFYPNDSFSMELYSDGKQLDGIYGKYKYNTETNVIQITKNNTETMDMQVNSITHIQVLSLSRSELEIRMPDDETPYRFIRY